MDIPITEGALEDLTQFAECLIHTTDLDPIYPMMKSYLKMNNATREESLWYIYLYMHWYSLASVIEVCEQGFNKPIKDKQTRKAFYEYINNEGYKLPIGMERRGFRNQPHIIIEAFESGLDTIDKAGGIEKFFDSLYTDVDGIEHSYSNELEYKSWKATESGLQKIKWWGTWASFKTCDLLKSVNGEPIKCPDMSLKGRLQYTAFSNILTVDNPKIEDMDLWGYELEKIMKKRIPEMTQDILETVVCKHHALTTYSYAIGYDIYHIKKQNKKIASKFSDDINNKLDKVMKMTFPKPYYEDFPAPVVGAYNNGKLECLICGTYERQWIDKSFKKRLF